MRFREGTSGCDRHRLVVLTLAVVGCASVLAACGSSGAARAGSHAGFVGGIKFADCMRSHGVPNFPDPSSGGGGVQIQAGSGVNPQSPAFQSAQSACVKLMPGPLGLGGKASESRKIELLRLAQCMRRHGFATFPDPTPNPPAPGTGFGLAFGAPGAFIAVPQTMLHSPAFKQAAMTCGFPGAGRHPGPQQPVPAP